MGLAVDSSGNIYIADTGDNLIREVTTDGNINYASPAMATRRIPATPPPPSRPFLLRRPLPRS